MPIMQNARRVAHKYRGTNETFDDYQIWHTSTPSGSEMQGFCIWKIEAGYLYITGKVIAITNGTSTGNPSHNIFTLPAGYSFTPGNITTHDTLVINSSGDTIGGKNQTDNFTGQIQLTATTMSFKEQNPITYRYGEAQLITGSSYKNLADIGPCLKIPVTQS